MIYIAFFTVAIVTNVAWMQEWSHDSIVSEEEYNKHLEIVVASSQSIFLSKLSVSASTT